MKESLRCLGVAKPANETRIPRTKAWTSRDPDHIPRGRRVLVRVDPFTIHRSASVVAETLGFEETTTTRYGVVEARFWCDGEYMIAMEASKWHFRMPRSALIYPIPDNVLPMARG